MHSKTDKKAKKDQLNNELKAFRWMFSVWCI